VSIVPTAFGKFHRLLAIVATRCEVRSSADGVNGKQPRAHISRYKTKLLVGYATCRAGDLHGGRSVRRSKAERLHLMLLRELRVNFQVSGKVISAGAGH